ncbi:hypothetical protein Bca101_019977 [Brassica carinata]
MGVDVIDNVTLCCHNIEEHPVKAKNRVLFCGLEVNGINTHCCFCASLHERSKVLIDNELPGLILLPFNSILGGTASSRPHFNNKNPTCRNLHIPH